ncbi:MAG: 4Fe-4S binding protein [Cyclobacteriaceae bacterium]|nr:4Fe-4S binding protein [Cyclobacteriaceae bacterium]
MQKAGIIAVLIGFGVFLTLPFITRHTLNEQLVAKEFGQEETSTLVSRELEPWFGKPLSSWKLISEIDKTIGNVNAEIVKRYALTSTDIDHLVELAKSQKLDEKHIEGLWGAFNFKTQSFMSYGSWLIGRSFNSDEELRNNIEQVANNITQYEVIPKKGIDTYVAKTLKYTLAKHSITGFVAANPFLLLFLTFGLSALGGLLMLTTFTKEPAGIKNNGIYFHPAKSRKWLGIIIGTLLIAFYIILYFYPQYMTGWIRMVDPISYLLSGNEAGQFFLYGLMYTVSVLVMGARMMAKYRHNRYQLVRTGSVMFFQTLFAFLIPEILVRLNQPYFDFKNAWPLNYDFFFDFNLNRLIASGNLGLFMLVWGIALSFIGVPLLTYFYGKRWYCSWVCGCGGLAETVGDPFRQLSDKSLRAWKIERVSIYSVLVFAVVMTIGVLYTYFTGSGELLGINTYSMRQVYGAFIGAGFAGVVGTGFYPFMGNRVWCRFGCPLAAYMGIVQRFKSRFRITTNGGQCISCGNCSTYCEMGIDVRSYAQRGENIVRASCVGCGVCAAVCPRGVLKLENVPVNTRVNTTNFVKR